MISETDQEALATLEELIALSPGIRLGQLFAHLGFLGECHLDRGLGDIEDDELLAVMYRHRMELLARTQGDSGDVQRSTGETSISGSSMLQIAAVHTQV
jgi:hypothetical protein